MSRGALSLVALLLCTAGASAQTTSTEILGTVGDASGETVPGAKVTLLRVATEEKRTAFTDDAGNYSFPLIEIGEYTVTAEKNGFKTQTQTGVVAALQQKARVNFVLEAGAATETVEVTASAVELKTDDAAVGQTIDQKNVLELPLNGRNFAGLAVLTAGVQYGTRMGLTGQAAGAFPFPGAATTLSANGQRDANQHVTMDGVVATEPLLNQVMFAPSIDAIEELKIQTGSYSAEYGQNNGAIVQIALRSGSNQFHGTFYEFLRNNAADARDYFLNFQLPAGTPPQPKNRLRRNQFGAWLAGPVLRDRTFWSFNYEGTRETQESVQEAFWFPDAFRNGDFSALLRPRLRDGQPVRPPIIIYDPGSGLPFRDDTGRINNIIPPSQIDRNAQNFVNRFLPRPDFTAEDPLDINVRRLVPAVLDQNQYFARLDHIFSSQDRIFVRYARQRTRYEAGSLNPNFPTVYSVDAHNAGFQHLHAFTPQVLSEFRVGFNKANHDQVNPRTYTDFDVDSLGIGQFRVAVDGNRKFNRLETGIPPTGVVEGDSGARVDLNGIYQFSENLSVNRGAHQYKAGFEYRRVGLDRAAANVPLGSIGCCEGGYPLAGWLLGYPSTTTTAEGLLYTAPRQNRWGAYVQDDWKITRKLTANLGVRWDFFQVAHDANRTWRTLRLGAPPIMIPAPGQDFNLYNTDNRYFMPRLGLAYRATDQWVIRSGFGWFANAQHLSNFTILSLQPPKSGTFGFNQVTDVAQVLAYEYAGQTYGIQTRRFRPGLPVLTLDNAFPGQGTAAARTNVLLFPPDNKASSVVQWSLDVQRALPGRAFLTVAYVGSKTSHLDNNIPNFNAPDPSPDTDINRRRPYQAYVSEGEGGQPRPLGNIRYLDSYANGSYHGLQVTLEKRYGRGLTAGLAYVYSKALGEGYGRNDPAGDVNATYQNPRNRRADRTRYGFDVTHHAAAHYVYALPWLRYSKGLVRGVLAGWQTTGVVTLRTGFPFSVSGGNLNTGFPSYPDRVADGRLFGQATRQRWFDPAGFRRTDCNIPNRPELCHYGNAGNGILVSPAGQVLDLSLGKNWALRRLGDQARLQFRAEAFNALNSPQFGRPNGIGWVGLDAVAPDAPRIAEIRNLRQPMRTFQFGVKLYF